MITTEQLKEILPNCRDPEVWAPLLSHELPEHKIDTKEKAARFLAQSGHESAQFTTLVENLNYSSDRLKVVFPKYFNELSEQELSKYHRRPEAIANRVYANRMGNGDEASGDGWKFRGKGLIQLTGKVNHMKCSEALFGNEHVLLDEPDLLILPEHALKSALWFWDSNKLVDVIDFILLTKKVNGGLIGLDERTALFNKALKVL